jgi:glycosyltransferase involved in cell wall biosynthesis
VPVDRGFRALFPLFPLAFRAFGKIDADVVLSSSSGWAHGVRASRRALHVVYCSTPARWLYTTGYEHGPSVRWVRGPLLAGARRWDQRAAARADHYIAISAFVADRIRRVYGLEAPVVHPPVDVERFTPSERGERLLVVSRLLRYKRVDVIVAAATSAGIGLDIVGGGPALDELRRAAGPTVEFHGEAGDAVVTELMSGCRALCVAGAEDFGIAPVEAQAAGKPVVAFARGGVLETVEVGVTGSLFVSQDVASVLGAIAHADRIDTPPAEIAEHARRFAPARFRERLTGLLGRYRAEHRREG